VFRFGLTTDKKDHRAVKPKGFDRGRFDELEPIAVVDIGSNSVRLVVYEGAVRAPTPLFNEKVLCGLGRSVSSRGMLDQAAVERALAALARFQAIARTLRAHCIQAIATAAVREASNGDAFIARAEEALGAPIQVLSGVREAELAAQGVQMGFVDPDGVIGDLGGGSLEVIDIEQRELKNAVTLPLGGLRLIDEAGGKLRVAGALADSNLDNVQWLKNGAGRTFYAVGGTWRALAKLHMAHNQYQLKVMHSYAVPVDEMIVFCEEVLKPRKSSEIHGFSTISKARRETLPFGALVLAKLLRRLAAKTVVFSASGIREGLVYGYLPEETQKSDPLLTFCEDCARLRSRSVQHAHELVVWTDALFQEGEWKESSEERRLRVAACLLSDIGWREHPDYRGGQSLNLVAHAALTGIDHPGRLFLALSIYFRHEGPGDSLENGLASSLIQLVGSSYIKRARVIAAAVRTAHMLSAGMPGVINETRLKFEPGLLVLELPRAHAVLNGERIRRRFKSLGGLLRRETEIRLVGS